MFACCFSNHSDVCANHPDLLPVLTLLYSPPLCANPSLSPSGAVQVSPARDQQFTARANLGQFAQRAHAHADQSCSAALEFRALISA